MFTAVAVVALLAFTDGEEPVPIPDAVTTVDAYDQATSTSTAEAPTLDVVATPVLEVALADTPKCVDNAELEAVRLNMSKTTVHSIFDFNGSQVRVYQLGDRTYELPSRPSLLFP